MERQTQLSPTGRTTPTTAPSSRAWRRRAVAPPVDVYENNDEFLLIADVPGVTRDGLSIELDRYELRIEGFRKGREMEGEAVSPDYRRLFTVPSGIDADNLRAELKNGVLTVHMPKSSTARARRVEVKQG